MKYVDTVLRQKNKETIDTFTEGIFCHTRFIGEKIIPMHVHINKSQLMYVGGKCIRIFYRIGDEVKTLFLPSRHFAWMPDGVLHSIESTNEDFTMRNIYFIDIGTDDFYKNVGVFAVNDLLLEMLKYIESWNSLILPTDEKRYTFLKALLLILPDTGHKKLPFALPMAKDERLKEILTYIELQLMNELRIESICTKFGFSPRNLLRLFQSDLKMPYAQYVKTLRAIRAIELLTTTSLTLTEIAFRVGYDSFPTFSNTFFEIVGVRPKAYKK